MYGLSKDLDLNFLNGREVVQVAIGVYQIQFGFDEDVIVYVESQFNGVLLLDSLIWCPKERLRLRTLLQRFAGSSGCSGGTYALLTTVDIDSGRVAVA